MNFFKYAVACSLMSIFGISSSTNADPLTTGVDFTVNAKSNLYFDSDPGLYSNGIPSTWVPLTEGVDPGQSLVVEASGSIVSGISQQYHSGPDGALGTEVGGLTWLSLIGRWSTSDTVLDQSTLVGDAFYVGASSILTAPNTQSGPLHLFLGVNDNNFYDNAYFDVNDAYSVSINPPPSQLSLGSSHACFLGNYEVTCWGNNSHGQSTVPTNLSHPVAIAAGSYHTCALDDNGVQCWGRNSYDEGTVPLDLSNPTMITAGMHYTCALDDNGVQCWGAYQGGASVVPSTISGPTTVDASSMRTCALDSSGALCWGDSSGSSAPSNLSNPTSIVAGFYQNCVLDDNGVQCWGDNTFGDVTVPSGLINPVAISAGKYRTCALDDSGVTCWGGGLYGTVTPPALSNPIQIASGGYYSCALDDTGVVCWGNNSAGQLIVPSNLRY